VPTANPIAERFAAIRDYLSDAAHVRHANRLLQLRTRVSGHNTALLAGDITARQYRLHVQSSWYRASGSREETEYRDFHERAVAAIDSDSQDGLNRVLAMASNQKTWNTTVMTQEGRSRPTMYVAVTHKRSGNDAHSGLALEWFPFQESSSSCDWLAWSPLRKSWNHQPDNRIMTATFADKLLSWDSYRPCEQPCAGSAMRVVLAYFNEAIWQLRRICDVVITSYIYEDPGRGFYLRDAETQHVVAQMGHDAFHRMRQREGMEEYAREAFPRGWNLSLDDFLGLVNAHAGRCDLLLACRPWPYRSSLTQRKLSSIIDGIRRHGADIPEPIINEPQS
jgi:hypothetical protein